MTNDLVTGADGFIGSHLVEALVQSGRRVRAFVQYNARNSWGWVEDLAPATLESVEVVSGDLRDAHSVREATRGCDRIFHLAALIAIPYSYAAPNEYLATNAGGTLNVLQAARDEGAFVVHTSTSEVYGTARYVPIDEEHPLQAQSPYAASKIAADKLAESFRLSYELPVITVRPFNAYGPRQSARAVIPTIITQALECPEIRLGSLDPVRDLTFVTDTVIGFLRAAETPAAVGEVVNLGQGSGVTIGELASEIFGILGVEKEIVTDPERIRPSASEVMRLVCDNSKAASMLGWKPAVSLSEGLRRTVEWFRSHLSSYKPHVYNR